MLLVVATDPETVEINYTWLPTWLGLNAQLLDRLAKKVRATSVGKPLTPELLYRVHEGIIAALAQEFPSMENLDLHLRSLENVRPTE